MLVGFDRSAATVRGLRYLGTDGPVAETAIDRRGPVGKLRRSMRAADAAPARRVRAQRLSRRAAAGVRPHFGEEAADLVALPTGPLIDRIRPA